MLLVAIDRKQTNSVLGDDFPYTLFTVNGKKPDFKMTQLNKHCGIDLWKYFDFTIFQNNLIQNNRNIKFIIISKSDISPH